MSVAEVAQTSVDKPRGAAARPRGEVTLFHQGDGQPSHRRVAGDAGAGDTPTDNRDVERLLAQPLQESSSTAVGRR